MEEDFVTCDEFPEQKFLIKQECTISELVKTKEASSMEDIKVKMEFPFHSMVPVIERLIWPPLMQSCNDTRIQNKNKESICSPIIIEHSTEDGFSLVKKENDENGQNDSDCDDNTETSSTKTSMREDEKCSSQTNIHTVGDIFCQCINCEKDFKSFKNIAGTKRAAKSCESTNGKPKSTCDICNRSFRRNCDLTTHMQSVHREKTDFCKICCKAFSTKYLKTHMETQHSSAKKVLNCDKCDRVYTSKTALKRHMLLKHNNAVKVLALSFPCDECGRNYKSRKDLTRHRKSKHTEDQEKYTCGHCNSEFTIKTNLSTHMVSFHLPPSVRCNLCDELFQTTKKMKQHLEAQHSIEQEKQSFVCETCGKTYDRYQALKYHTKTSHSTNKMMFECEHCEKSFHAKHLMVQHSLVHSDIRKFKCEECDQSFKLRHHLKQHMAVHGQEIPRYQKKLEQLSPVYPDNWLVKWESDSSFYPF